MNNLELTQEISKLALTFPTLLVAPGIVPFEARTLDAWAAGPTPGDGARFAAQFILGVWNNSEPWECGRFDVIETMSFWDDEHRKAFEIGPSHLGGRDLPSSRTMLRLVSVRLF